MSDECMELKNIKYQTMLLNNNSKISETIPNILNIEKFLSEEKEVNKNKPWNKLNKGSKIKLIGSFSEEYQMKNNISETSRNTPALQQTPMFYNQNYTQTRTITF